MSINPNKILETIYDAIDEFNTQEPEKNRIKKSKDTILFGEDGKLDSLGLINFIIEIEQKIEENFNVPITLAVEKAMSQKNSPLRSIKTLAKYCSELLRDSND